MAPSDKIMIGDPEFDQSHDSGSGFYTGLYSEPNRITYLKGIGTRFYTEHDFDSGIIKLFDLLSHPLILAEKSKLFQEIEQLPRLVLPQDTKDPEQIKTAEWLAKRLADLDIDAYFNSCLNAYITGLVGHEMVWCGTQRKPTLDYLKAVPPELYSVQSNGLRFLANANNYNLLTSGGKYKDLVFTYDLGLKISPIGDGVGKVLYYLIKDREEAECRLATYLQKGITPTLIVSAEAGVQKAVVQNITRALSLRADWKTIAVPKGVTVKALEVKTDYAAYEYGLAENEKLIQKLISGESIIGVSNSITSRSSAEASNLRRCRANTLAKKVIKHINKDLIKILIDVELGVQQHYPVLSYALPPLNSVPVASIADAIAVSEKLGYTIDPSFFEENYRLDVKDYGLKL